MDMVLDIATKIRNMEIRGAGTIARAAVKALKDYALRLHATTKAEFDNQMSTAAKVLVDTRPTAVSLPNAVRMVMAYQSNTTTIASESALAIPL
jgi:ribose 1,5-bisphosphate isomerase